MFDPNQWYDEQLRRLGGGAAAEPRGLPALSDADEESALGSLGRKVMGGVGYAAGVLDKTFGGRALRGAIGGKPRELLSILPGSDTLGLTDENDVVHGRDLLEQAGLVSHAEPGSGLDLGDVAGFGVDVALDPSVYFGNWVGALGKATGATAGLGRLAMKIPGVARAGEALAPVGRGLKAVFGKDYDNTTSALMQPAMVAKNELVRQGTAGAKDLLSEQAQRLRDAGQLTPANDRLLRDVLENNFVGPLPPELGAVGAEMRKSLDNEHLLDTALGADAKYRPGYAPRGKTPYEPGAGGGGGRAGSALGPMDPSMVAREEIFEGLPTSAVNAIGRDKNVSGAARLIQQAQPVGVGDKGNLLQEAAHIARTYLEPHGITGPGAAGQAAGLADWAASLQPGYSAGEGLDFFGNSLFNDVQTRLARGAARRGTLEALYDVLGQAATGSMPGAATVPLDEVLRKIPHLEEGTARNVLMRRMGLTPEQFLQRHVPAEVANDVERAVRGFTTPTALEPLLRAYDSVTALTRMGQTALWPPKYLRNLVQQTWGMFVGGHSDPTAAPLMGYAKPMMEAGDLFRAGPGYVLADANTIPGLAHLSPEEATRALQREMYAHDVAGPGKLTAGMEQSGAGAAHAAQQTFYTPGDAQPGLWDVLKGAVPTSLEEATPWNIRGFNGRAATGFAPARAGQELDQYIDELTRGGSYLALRRQGLDPAAAAAGVRKVHYDYSNLSDAERAIFRRAMPFYSWSRQNLPAQLEQIISNPGGKTAQAVRAVNDLHQKEGFVPPDVAEGIGAPVGAREGDTQRYLTSLGLPFEDLSDFVTGRGATGDVAETTQRQLANLNPLLKAPLELATGKQFVSGRDLHDLYGPTGDVGLDQLVMNSPLSRFYTAGRTLLDPRKEVGVKLTNLLSPAKFTDVDMAKRRDVAARELVTDLLQQYPQVHQFSQPWVKPEDLGRLDPEAQALLGLYKNLEQKAQQRSREEKKVGVRK